MGFYFNAHLVRLLNVAALTSRENVVKLLVFLTVKLEVGSYCFVGFVVICINFNHMNSCGQLKEADLL